MTDLIRPGFDASLSGGNPARMDAPTGRGTASGPDENPIEADLLGREFAFLLACVRRFFQPETPIPSATGLDWRKLVQLAEGHAVVALLCQAVQGYSEIPTEVLDDLRRRCFEGARFDLTLSEELVRVLELFEGHQIQVVALKGPVLGLTLYGTEGLRSCSDLDLLVHPSDLLRAKRLLESTGYRLESVLCWPVDKACFRRRDSQISFSRQTAGQIETLWIDLHWRLLPGYFLHSFDDCELWRNLRKIPVTGISASTLQPEDLLLFLCAHGTKHLWGRLGWICDIARLLQLERSLNWPRVFAEARQMDISRMVVLGLLLASELLGVDLPPTAVEYTRKDRTDQAVAAIKKRLYGQVLTPPSGIEYLLFTRHMFDRAGNRVRFILGHFLAPTELEYQAIKLPPLLHWVYYLFRPIRLIGKYARAWFDGIWMKERCNRGSSDDHCVANSHRLP